MGFEPDLYVHLEGGAPISVESEINRRIETPISKSDTWKKISSGRADALDRSDKPILYALIRHLHARSPHYLETITELANHSDQEDGQHKFTAEERKMYAAVRKDPNLGKAIFNATAASLEWSRANFVGAGLSIFRSRIPMRSSSIPVLAIPAPAHPNVRLPLPSTTPHQLLLTLNRTTIASLVLGDFDDAFVNIEIDNQVARAFQRYYLGQFTRFSSVRHLITEFDENLKEDMTWAGYDVVELTERKVTFRR